jgi:hypothetical protein
MALLFAILLTVTLSPPFGDAEARALGAPSARTIDVTVQVEGTPTAVIARITGIAGELDPVALVPRGNGAYGQAIRLTAWEDIHISFEYIGTDGETTISAPSSLTALGVDPVLMAPTLPSVPTPHEESGLNPWLFAGIAAALIVTVFVVFWLSGSLGDSLKPADWTYAGTEAALAEESSAPPESTVQSPESGVQSPEFGVHSPDFGLASGSRLSTLDCRLLRVLTNCRDSSTIRRAWLTLESSTTRSPTKSSPTRQRR